MAISMNSVLGLVDLFFELRSLYRQAKKAKRRGIEVGETVSENLRGFFVEVADEAREMLRSMRRDLHEAIVAAHDEAEAAEDEAETIEDFVGTPEEH